MKEAVHVLISGSQGLSGHDIFFLLLPHFGKVEGLFNANRLPIPVLPDYIVVHHTRLLT